MRLLRTVAGVVIGVVLASGSMVASDPIGVIAILTKVQMEPNDQAPERIKLWGAFSVPTPGGGVHRNPARKGVTYFKLTPGRETEIRNEWADLKAMAGTGRAVGFGSFWVPANDPARPGLHVAAEVRVYAEDAAAVAMPYPTNIGIQRLGTYPADVIAELRTVLGRKPSP